MGNFFECACDNENTRKESISFQSSDDQTVILEAHQNLENVTIHLERGLDQLTLLYRSDLTIGEKKSFSLPSINFAQYPEVAHVENTIPGLLKMANSLSKSSKFCGENSIIATVGTCIKIVQKILIECTMDRIQLANFNHEFAESFQIFDSELVLNLKFDVVCTVGYFNMSRYSKIAK